MWTREPADVPRDFLHRMPMINSPFSTMTWGTGLEDGRLRHLPIPGGEEHEEVHDFTLWRDCGRWRFISSPSKSALYGVVTLERDERMGY
ncbi:hypothetical protein INR49_011868 [Caranx melampygus]|nr:hypothetical protein INR49_011868 [Caranx melampygus]